MIITPQRIDKFRYLLFPVLYFGLESLQPGQLVNSDTQFLALSHQPIKRLLCHLQMRLPEKHILICRLLQFMDLHTCHTEIVVAHTLHIALPNANALRMEPTLTLLTLYHK